MNRLAPAIRLRRRALDALALEVAAAERTRVALVADANSLSEQRRAERTLTAAVPLAADAWFDDSARCLLLLGAAREEAEARLAALRRDTVEARARLQLLEDAAAAAARAERRRRERRNEAALDDRISSAWVRRR